ncbi:MAG: hypothetical protein CR972_00105 [Candidatus Moraniibacteriota bacterium]|nr:MAG: hypothetical protein CR972_00105 [Candidatus Moranbacteria bacterium]
MTTDVTQKKPSEEIAISAHHVSKKFRIPHEKVDTIRGVAVSAFKKNSYEEFLALDDVSFDVKKGEFFGIIGRNGGGKSTLLKILANIYTADTGQVKINGRISPFLELGIGFNPELSGRDNIYLNASVLGMSQKEIDEKFNDIVAFSELERFIDQKLKNYSSGMQVRLAFSVSIHANRDILLMDEVLAVGDNNFQSKCLDEFYKYRDMGRTVIIVTHDVSVVEKYCDRALLLREGSVAALGTASDVVMQYVAQNMHDEEKRHMQTGVTNGLNQNDKKNSHKIANIIDATFLDEKNTVRHVFEVGEKIHIQITYRINQKIENPIFGVLVRDVNNTRIFCTNTTYVKVDTDTVKKGVIRVTFVLENYFADGVYTITPAIAMENKANIDLKDCFKSFKVINANFKSNAAADFPTDVFIEKID